MMKSANNMIIWLISPFHFKIHFFHFFRNLIEFRPRRVSFFSGNHGFEADNYSSKKNRKQPSVLTTSQHTSYHPYILKVILVQTKIFLPVATLKIQSAIVPCTKSPKIRATHKNQQRAKDMCTRQIRHVTPPK